MILDYDYREVFVFGNILQKVALKKDTILYLTCDQYHVTGGLHEQYHVIGGLHDQCHVTDRWN
jgi:ABC-type enterochelin transport system substrate-binding protein